MTSPDEPSPDPDTATPEPETTGGPQKDTDPAATGATTSGRLARLLAGVLAVLLIAAIGSAGVLGWQWKDRRDTDRAATAALAAAQQYAVALTSIDTDEMDADFAAIADGATGEFKNMYTRSAEQLKPLLAQAQSVSKGRVVAASVQSASRDRVVVMLFVDAEITNTTTPQPRLDRNRIIMTMDRVGDRWLAGDVELV
ncbi:hypothetical protein [Nocardia carnea]|uniref:hypothetical protein n=1 Tax=Nocardia carnea TaxID=37328 RepID=UPI002456A64F|nr:hypothetical protein [Nocardia carnea]